jgi:hypothetical protein
MLLRGRCLHFAVFCPAEHIKSLFTSTINIVHTCEEGNYQALKLPLIKTVFGRYCQALQVLSINALCSAGSSVPRSYIHYFLYVDDATGLKMPLVDNMRAGGYYQSRTYKG